MERSSQAAGLEERRSSAPVPAVTAEIETLEDAPEPRLTREEEQPFAVAREAADDVEP